VSRSQKKLLNTVKKIDNQKGDKGTFTRGAMYVNNIYTSTLIKIFGRKVGMAIADFIIDDFHKEIKDVKPLKFKRKT
jgi:hypothetical protein